MRCNKNGVFTNSVVNYELQQIVEDVKKNVFKYYDYWQERVLNTCFFHKTIQNPFQLVDNMALNSGICDSCSNFSSRLRMCKECCLQEGTVPESIFENEIHLVVNIAAADQTVCTNFARHCVHCILDGRTPHTNHITIASSQILMHSVGKYQIAMNYVAYKILKETIMEMVGRNNESINSCFRNLHYTIWQSRRFQHLMNSHLNDSNSDEEKKLIVELRKHRERNRRCEEIEILRKILIKKGIAITRIPDGLEKVDSGKLIEMEKKLEEFKNMRLR